MIGDHIIAIVTQYPQYWVPFWTSAQEVVLDFPSWGTLLWRMGILGKMDWRKCIKREPVAINGLERTFKESLDPVLLLEKIGEFRREHELLREARVTWGVHGQEHQFVCLTPEQDSLTHNEVKIQQDWDPAAFMASGRLMYLRLLAIQAIKHDKRIGWFTRPEWDKQKEKK